MPATIEVTKQLLETVGRTRRSHPSMSRRDKAALAKKYGITYHQVMRIRAIYGRLHNLAPNPGSPRSLSVEQEQELLRLLDLREQLTNKALARRFGISHKSIPSLSHRLRKNRLAKPKDGGH